MFEDGPFEIRLIMLSLQFHDHSALFQKSWRYQAVLKNSDYENKIISDL